jgi:hypothetical protein
VNAPTLSAIFEEARPRLADELTRCDSPAEKRERLRAFLDSLPEEYLDLAHAQGETVSRKDVDKVRDLLDILQAALGAVSVVVSVPSAPVQPDMPPGPSEGGLIGRFLGRGRPSYDPGWPAQDPGRDTHQAGYPEPLRAPDGGHHRARLEVRALRYLEATGTALEAADRVLEADTPEPEPPSVTSGQAPDWATDSQLLDLFQDLMAARTTGNPAMALQRIEQLEDDLRTFYGISTVRYDHASEETAGWFSILPLAPGAPAEYVTRRPALVRDQEVLRRGEVRGPSADPPDAVRPVSASAPFAPDAPDDHGHPHDKEHADD